MNGTWFSKGKTKGFVMFILCKKNFLIWSCEAIKIPTNNSPKYYKYLKTHHIYYVVFSCVWKFVVLFFCFELCSLVHDQLVYVFKS